MPNNQNPGFKLADYEIVQMQEEEEERSQSDGAREGRALPQRGGAARAAARTQGPFCTGPACAIVMAGRVLDQ